VKLQDVLPVILSVAVIIAIAVIEKQSKLIAAITSTMPLGMPLALWIVWAGNDGDRGAIQEFTSGMAISIVPTLGFLAAIWVASRVGLKLVPVLAIGFGV